MKRNNLCCGNREIELHGFCDATTLAYGAVIFVRSICLWAAKSCVVLNKVNTVPRLFYCHIDVKLVMKEIVKVAKFFYWNDSQNVLCWLK